MKIRLLVLRGLWVVTLLFAFSINTSAQGANSLLWEISGNGLEQPSYLYGTIHIICPDDFIMSDELKTAFKEADQIAMEVDLADQLEMQAFQTGMMKMEGVDYEGMMTEEDYNKLDGIIKSKYGTGLSAMKIMKPFGMLSVMYTELIECAAPESYELSFMQMAKDQEKEIFGLESAASQVAIFDNIPEKEQVEWIVDMMNNADDSKAEFAKMVSDYKAQDLEALFASMAESPEYAKYEEQLLDNRNEAWIPKIGKLTKDKSTFIAVGAMHLAGENGVIKLLKAAGYTVKPMANK